MGTAKRSKQDKLFDSLVNFIKNQQEQLKTLVDNNKILQDRVKTLNERWLSDVRFYQDNISQMKDVFVEKDMACLLEAAKSDLMIGLKERETAILKLKLEQIEDELADFRACFDYLSSILDKNSKETDTRKGGGRFGDLKSTGSKKLDNEVKRLKLEYEKLASEKQSEISALLKEKGFAWHQYNVLESSLADKLKSKQAEVDQTKEKFAKVLSSVELLQSSNSKKDEMIEELKAKLTEVEADRNKGKEEISRLSQVLESLGKSRSTQVIPASIPVNEGAKCPKKNAAKGSRSLKRKGDEVITILETPKLFTTAFKVPKLKTPSTITSSLHTLI